MDAGEKSRDPRLAGAAGSLNLSRLSAFTPARVGLGAAGVSLRSRDVLAFQLAHAQARDAVHAALDLPALTADLGDCLLVHSAAPDRAAYLRRPDLGRRLDAESRSQLQRHAGSFDLAIVVADGLSALAVHRHAAPVVNLLRQNLSAADWRIAPLVVVSQGRVAIGDDIGEVLGADLAIVLIGERPGLSAPDSLGIYLTWQPRPGRTDSERNCISNIHAEGLSYPAAVHRLLFLLTESRRRRISGVALRENAGLLPLTRP
jgi:ethanolamine ammonia-lyase small subunit